VDAMAGKTLRRSFAGGEISPDLYARVDLDKYQTGLSLCQNAWVLPQGAFQNRPGFQYVQRTKYSYLPSRLINFSYNTEQTFALEFGEGYIRFHTQGGTLLESPVFLAGITLDAPGIFSSIGTHGFSVGQWVLLRDIGGMPDLSNVWAVVASVPTTSTFTLTDLFGDQINTSGMPGYTGLGSASRIYEVATPYSSSNLDTLNYVQSADVLTLVSPNYAPVELRRLGATNWTLQPITFSSSLSPPQSNGATPSAIEHFYSVIGFLGNNITDQWTQPGDAVVMNDLTIPGRTNVISWNSVSSALTYLIFKRQPDGSFLQIGTSRQNNSFVDDGTAIPQDTGFPKEPQLVPAMAVSATAIAPFSTGVSVTPTGGGTKLYRYVVTSYNSATHEESIASGEGSASGDLTLSGGSMLVRWPAVPGVSEYNVYRYSNGLWGFVGTAGSDCTFTDNNILPETGITPPIQIDPFQGAGNFPRAVTYHEQRRVFGGTVNAPQTLWMTRSGTEKNLGYSIPGRADDGITQRVVSRQANTIRHFMPMTALMLLTSGGEWRIESSDGGALTPNTFSAKQQGYSGASQATPILTNRTILFAQSRGGHIRELEYSFQQQGYLTTDVSILAPHLFDYYTVRQMAFSQSPVPIVWSVRSDGVLLGMTYITEHEIRAWHQHKTLGLFESCCVVEEGDEDVLYVVVNRTVRSQTVRYIERLHSRRFATAADQFFVDSGLTYTGAPVSEVGGLQHLEGLTVSILADGGVSPPQIVANGRVSLDGPASKVHIGLAYVTRGATLPMSLETEAAGQGAMKNINKVHMRVLASNGFKAGPDFDHLRPVLTRAEEPYGSPPDLITDESAISMDPHWTKDGLLCFEQSDPLGLMVLGMTLEVASGG